MSTTRFNELIRGGFLYRYEGLQDPIANGVQAYLVVKAGPTKNLIVERTVIQSNEGRFEVGTFLNEPYTGGLTVPLGNNADNSIIGGLLEGVVVENPTVTGAPLLLPNSSTRALVSEQAPMLDEESPLIVPAGNHAVIMFDNQNKGGTSAKMILKLWLREEGR